MIENRTVHILHVCVIKIRHHLKFSSGKRQFIKFSIGRYSNINFFLQHWENSVELGHRNFPQMGLNESLVSHRGSE